jgi:hypothetical protein
MGLGPNNGVLNDVFSNFLNHSTQMMINAKN